MSFNDDNDLTDRYEELLGDTLEDMWEDNPDPPDSYGRPGPRTIMDNGNENGSVYAWSWNDGDDEIEYDGDLAWVIR